MAKKGTSAQWKSARSDLAWRVVLHLFVAAALTVTTVTVYRICRVYVDRDLQFPTRPPRVVLQNRPDWMSDYLADQIARSAQPTGLHSTFDHQLLVDTANQLQANPWVRKVNQVRRSYGDSPGDTLLIDCEYRAPAALAQWGSTYWLVDADGVKLPEKYGPDDLSHIMLAVDGSVNIRVIQGLAKPPKSAGEVWPGDDLAGGLELAKLLAGQNWAAEIQNIDVSNFAGRQHPRDAQIVLVTRYGTQIRWGRPPGAKDAFVEVPVATKLATLEKIFEEKTRIDAGEPWLDLRFDQVMYPAPAQQADASPTPSHAIVPHKIR